MAFSHSFIAAKESSPNDYLDLHRADALGHDGDVHMHGPLLLLSFTCLFRACSCVVRPEYLWYGGTYTAGNATSVFVGIQVLKSGMIRASSYLGSIPSLILYVLPSTTVNHLLTGLIDERQGILTNVQCRAADLTFRFSLWALLSQCPAWIQRRELEALLQR